MTQHSPVSIPVPTVAFSEWLPLVGDQAFLTWLRFRSWSPTPDTESPSVISLPISHIIKQLKIGNSTFYDKILRPLWNYGFIELTPSEDDRRCSRITVYPYPQKLPQTEQSLSSHQRGLSSHRTKLFPQPRQNPFPAETRS